MALVTDVKTPRRGTKRRILEVDHSEWRETSAEVLAPLGVRPGHIGPLAELEAAIDAAEPVRARERALRLLAFRERSAAELAGRLEEDGYPAQVVRATVDSLVRSGLVDDARFAAVTARGLTRVRGMGRSRALRDLAVKGVDPEIAREAVDEALPPDDEAEAAADLAHALARRPGATVDKVAARLARKGYAPALALRSARQALETLDEAGGDGPPDDPSDLHQDYL